MNIKKIRHKKMKKENLKHSEEIKWDLVMTKFVFFCVATTIHWLVSYVCHSIFFRLKKKERKW